MEQGKAFYGGFEKESSQSAVCSILLSRFAFQENILTESLSVRDNPRPCDSKSLSSDNPFDGHLV